MLSLVFLLSSTWKRKGKHNILFDFDSFVSEREKLLFNDALGYKITQRQL